MVPLAFGRADASRAVALLFRLGGAGDAGAFSTGFTWGMAGPKNSVAELLLAKRFSGRALAAEVVARDGGRGAAPAVAATRLRVRGRGEPISDVLDVDDVRARDDEAAEGKAIELALVLSFIVGVGLLWHRMW